MSNFVALFQFNRPKKMEIRSGRSSISLLNFVASFSEEKKPRRNNGTQTCESGLKRCGIVCQFP